MGEEAGITNTALTEIRSAVDLLHGRLAVIDTTQQSLMAQVNIMAEPVKDAPRLHVAHARALHCEIPITGGGRPQSRR
jgi:hypothetical protein